MNLNKISDLKKAKKQLQILLLQMILRVSAGTSRFAQQQSEDEKGQNGGAARRTNNNPRRGPLKVAKEADSFRLGVYNVILRDDFSVQSFLQDG